MIFYILWFLMEADGRLAGQLRGVVHVSVLRSPCLVRHQDLQEYCHHYITGNGHRFRLQSRLHCLQDHNKSLLAIATLGSSP